MGISLRPEYLKRYKDLALLLIKYGRSDIVRQAGLDKTVMEDERPTETMSAKAEELPDDLERLGPTYIKLGQFLSTRSDILPPPYLDALARLQDKIEPFSSEEAQEIITSDLGVRISKGFSEFETKPLAAASLAQVHRAALRDGRPVAVKVQRPGIRDRMVKDLDALEDVVEFLDKHTVAGKRYMLLATLEEFRKATLRELDFRQEAHNLTLLGENLKDFKWIVVPRPVEDYTSSRVLTMDYIRGEKITTMGPLRRQEINGTMLAEELFRAYLKQILVDGFYHADPHPGNVFMTQDGRIALIDLGMVARVSEDLQENMLRLILAISEGRGEEAVEYAMEIAEKTSSFEEKRFSHQLKELVAQYQNATIGEIQVGRVLMEVFKFSGESGIRFPSEIAILGKALLNLDNVGRSLDPTFDPNAAVRGYASELFRKRLRKSVSIGNFYEALMESKEFVQLLPRRVNKIMDTLANNEFTIHVNTMDEKYLMTGFQKLANRLTLGLILAALIVGAALMMRVETAFTVFGYPGIAIIFFLLAAIGAAIMAFKIVFQDEPTKRRE